MSTRRGFFQTLAAAIAAPMLPTPKMHVPLTTEHTRCIMDGRSHTHSVGTLASPSHTHSHPFDHSHTFWDGRQEER